MPGQYRSHRFVTLPVNFNLHLFAVAIGG